MAVASASQDMAFPPAEASSSPPGDPMAAQISAMQATCKASSATEPPTGDRPTAAEVRRLQDCSSTDDYYGVDGRRDVVRARKCAFIELDAAAAAPQGPAGPWGAGVLMMVYAKGEGVKQNPAYARRMACTAGYSAMDKVSLLEKVEAARSDPKANVDVCWNIASGWLVSMCAEQESERRDQERELRIARLQRGWSSGRLMGWKQVVASRTAFEDARVDNEVDTSGTLRGQFIAKEQAFIRDFEEGLLRDLTRGRLGGSGAGLAKADRDMNLAYRRLMAEPVDDLTWPAREDIRATQRQWLLHRDCWRRFAEAGWPGNGDAVVARLTAERRIMLACLLDETPRSGDCRRYQSGS